MPFIQIKSLPFDRPFDMAKVIIAVGKDFAGQNNIPLEHVIRHGSIFNPDIMPRVPAHPNFSRTRRILCLSIC